MALGGARPGAGRPKGARNKRHEEVVQKAVAGGITPLEYLLSVMQNEEAEEAKRIDAAKAAAPYVHARLSNVDMNAKVDARAKIEVLTGVPRD